MRHAVLKYGTVITDLRDGGEHSFAQDNRDLVRVAAAAALLGDSYEFLTVYSKRAQHMITIGRQRRRERICHLTKQQDGRTH